jgi:hypothetical protein
VAVPKRGRVYASRQGPRHRHQLFDRGGSTAHEPSNDDDYDGAKHGDQNTFKIEARNVHAYQLTGDPAANKGADDPQHNIADHPVTAASNQHTGQPASDQT